MLNSYLLFFNLRMTRKNSGDLRDLRMLSICSLLSVSINLKDDPADGVIHRQYLFNQVPFITNGLTIAKTSSPVKGSSNDSVFASFPNAFSDAMLLRLMVACAVFSS